MPDTYGNLLEYINIMKYLQSAIKKKKKKRYRDPHHISYRKISITNNYMIIKTIWIIRGLVNTVNPLQFPSPDKYWAIRTLPCLYHFWTSPQKEVLTTLKINQMPEWELFWKSINFLLTEQIKQRFVNVTCKWNGPYFVKFEKLTCFKIVINSYCMQI